MLRATPFRRPDDLVEGAQEPQPALEADPLTLVTLRARLGLRHQPEAADGRVGLVQADADLHASIIAGPPGANIGQPADVDHPRQPLALAIWALARLLGVELTVGNGQHASQVDAVDVLAAALLAGLAAWGTRALLARRGADRAWPIVAATALGISYIGPSYLADGLSALVLSGIHLAVGLVLIAGFSGFAPREHRPAIHAQRP